MKALPPLIAVDWGSTHFRAKLFVEGQILASVSSPDGIRHREGRDCDTILSFHCGAWKHTHPDARVLMSGMIGAREGWFEVPYVASPCGPADLAAAAVAVPSTTFGEVFIIPGVRCDDPDTDTNDVMRGEETQIAGLLDSLPAMGAVVCLPGTHSKWALCQDGAVCGFRTWLTGEAYECLTRESLISGDGTPAEPESEAFARGLEESDLSGGLLHHLFLGRTHLLAGRLDASQMRSYVSGLLIGHELREALAFAPQLPIHLVGDSPAATAMRSALGLLGVPHVQIHEDVHLSGLVAIAANLKA